MAQLSTQRAPWHKPLKGKQTSPAAIQEATGTAFEVEKAETYVDVGDDTFAVIPGLLVMVRSDTRRPLAPVGPNVKLSQLDIHAEVADQIRKQTKGTFVTGGMLTNDTAHYVVKLAEQVTVAKDEIYDSYVALLPQIGTTALEVIFFGNRLASHTTHIWGTTALRHGGDSALEAKRLIGMAEVAAKEFVRDAKRMLANKISFEQVGELYRLLWAQPTGKTQKALSLWNNRCDELTEVWENSVSISEVRNTVYGVYVAAHEFTQYSRSLRGTSGDRALAEGLRSLDVLQGVSRSKSLVALEHLPEYKGTVTPAKVAKKPAAKSTKAPAKTTAKRAAKAS